MDEQPYDLSGASDVEISLKQAIPETLFVKSGANVTISGDGNERATAMFSPSETLQLQPGFAFAQIRVKNGDVVLGERATVVRIAAVNNREAL